MIDTIYINDELRVRDADINQYNIEYLSGHNKTTGKDLWTVYAYCATIKGLAAKVREFIGTQAANKARVKAEAAYMETGMNETLLALPKKGPNS